MLVREGLLYFVFLYIQIQVIYNSFSELFIKKRNHKQEKSNAIANKFFSTTILRNVWSDSVNWIYHTLYTARRNEVIVIDVLNHRTQCRTTNFISLTLCCLFISLNKGWGSLKMLNNSDNVFSKRLLSWKNYGNFHIRICLNYNTRFGSCSKLPCVHHFMVMSFELS